MERQLIDVTKENCVTVLITVRKKWFGRTIKERFLTHDGFNWLLDKGIKKKYIPMRSELSGWLTLHFAWWVTGKLKKEVDFPA